MRTPRPIPAPVCLTAARAPVRAGADPDAGFIYGNTALNSAAAGGRMAEVLQQSLAAGGDPNRKNNAGYAPVHEAAIFGKVVVLRRLLAAGGDPNIQGFKDYTPLHWAAVARFADAVELLLQHHADVDIKNIDGRTALDAVRREDTRIRELLEAAAA